MSGNMLERDDVEACVQALSLMYGCIPPMLARVACELGVPDVLQAAGEPLSALQIAERIFKCPSPVSQAALQEAANRLERVMRCLSAHGVFNAHVDDDSAASAGLVQGGSTPVLGHVAESTYVDVCSSEHVASRPARYCLNAVSRWLVRYPRDKDPEGSLRGLLLFLSSPTLMMAWQQLTEHIMEGGPEPFARAHGMQLWRYAQSSPEFNALLNNAMSSDTVSLQALLMHYDGFAGIHTLVDVGGGIGTAAAHIVSFYPSLKVICLDLPHVIATAPYRPGVEYVVGDMFESIPKGDAIFMKWILHDWSDEDCINILKNCHKAIPKHGKVIIMEAVMENIGQERNSYSKLRTLLDVSMLAGTKGGRERTKKQWEDILKASNFGEYKIFDLPCPQCIIEAFPIINSTSFG